MDLTGQVGVVTGASRGLGLEVARALAAAGATPVLCARDADALQKAATEITSSFGQEAVTVACDISSSSGVQMITEAVESRFGGASMLVNAAGMFGPIASVAESNPDEWIQTLLTNAIGPYLTIRALLPGMLTTGYGRIVNVSSAAAFMDATPLNSAYSVSKAALNRLTRHLASELEGVDVKVNVLHPGSLKTAMWSDIKSQTESIPEATTLRGWVELVEETGGDSMDEAVALVMSLLSPDCEITGEFCWPRDMVISKPIPTW